MAIHVEGLSARHESFAQLKRRTFVFSVLGALACLVLFAAFGPSDGAPTRAAALALMSRGQGGGRSFEWSHAPELLVVGVAAGLLAGLLGMGGGVLKMAGMLVVFELDVITARAISLTTMFLATASAARVHIREGAVLWPVVRPMIGPAIIGVLLGMFVGFAVPRVTLTHTFAFFAILLGLNILGQTLADPHESALHVGGSEPSAGGGRFACYGIGALHGVVCGLLGISGGVIAMPMQQIFAGVPARHAVANSVVVSALCTSVGSVVAVLAGVVRRDFHVTELGLAILCIGAGAVAGAQIGARWTGVLPAFVLRLLFVLVSVAAGLIVLLR